MPAEIVTIVVPGRDIASFAPAALQSLRAQTERRWRAILVDDGSVDETGKIFAAAAAQDSRFRLISHAEPLGLGAARNAALTQVDTPLLGFLDADDEFTPTAIARLTQTLFETGSDFVAGAYVRNRWNGTHYRPGRIQPWVTAATSPARLGTNICEHPHASGNIVAWSKISRTDLWHSLRFAENVAYEDQIVAQQMYTTARRFDVIPDVIAHWRLRADGSSLSQSKAQLPVLRDYLAALHGGLRVLSEAEASAAVLARLNLIFAMDVPPLAIIAETHRDPRYSQELRAFLDGLRALPEFAYLAPDQSLALALDW